MGGHTEGEVWRAFLADPCEARFRPVYDRTRGRVFTICRRILCDEADALDAFQATYARMIALAREGPAREPFADEIAAATRLAVRESDNLRKRRATRARREVAMDPMPIRASTAPGPARAAADRQLREKLEDLVDALPDRYRLPVLLHYFHGMPRIEIAQALGKSPATVSSRIERALKLLRPMLWRMGLGEIGALLGGVAAASGWLHPPSALAAEVVFADGLASAAAGAATADAGARSSLAWWLSFKVAAALLGLAATLTAAGIYLARRPQAPPRTNPVALQAAPTISAADPSFGAATEVSRPPSTSPSQLPSHVEPSPMPTAATVDAADAQADPADPPPPESARADAPANATETSTPTNLRSLTVRVFRAADGLPAPGARVALNRDGIEAIADRFGEVRFPALDPSIWGISVFAPDFAVSMHNVNLIPRREASLEVGLHPGGAIVGRVIDPEGEPIEGASVRLADLMATMTMDIVESDAEGAFRFEHAPLGKPVSLFAVRPGFENRTIKGIVVPAESGVARREVAMTRAVALGAIAGRVLDADGEPVVGAAVRLSRGALDLHTVTDAAGRFRLDGLPHDMIEHIIVVRAIGYAPHATPVRPGTVDAPAEVIVSLERGHRLGGRIIDERGEPIPGATIEAMGESFTTRPSAEKSVQSDETGRFEFAALAASVEQFRISKPGYSFRYWREFELDRDDREIVLRDPGLIVGRVIDADTGDPVPRFNIRVDRTLDRRPEEPYILGMRTDLTRDGLDFVTEDGFFRIDGTPAGAPIRLLVSAPGYSLHSFDRVTPRTELTFDPIELELAKGARRVRGVVARRDGGPVDGVQATLLIYTDERSRDLRPYFDWSSFESGLLQTQPYIANAPSAPTDAGGEFEFDSIPEGAPFDLVLIGPTIVRTWLRAMEKKSAAELENLILSPKEASRLIVKIDRDRFPESHMFMVRPIGDPNSAVRRLVDLDATEFEIDGLEAGGFLLTVGGGRIPLGLNVFFVPDIARFEFQIGEGEVREVDLGAGSFRRVGGRILKAGAPLARGLIALVNFEPRVMIYGRTDADGRFDLPVVQSGRYRLRDLTDLRSSSQLEMLRAPAAAISVEVGDKDLEGDFDLIPPSTVLGRWTGLDAALPMTLTRERPSDPSQAPVVLRSQIDPETGAFRFEGAPEGRFKIQFQQGGGTLLARAGIDLPPADGTTLDLGDLAVELGAARVRAIDGELVEGRSSILSISLHPQGDSPIDPLEDIPLAEGKVLGGEREGEIERAPVGPARLLVSSKSYVVEPMLTPVEIVAGKTVSVDVRVRPIAHLRIAVWEKRPKFVKVRLIPPDGGAPLEPPIEAPKPPPLDAIGYARATETEIIARGLTPGIWTAEIEMEAGKTFRKQIELHPGLATLELIRPEHLVGADPPLR